MYRTKKLIFFFAFFQSSFIIAMEEQEDDDGWVIVQNPVEGPSHQVALQNQVNTRNQNTIIFKPILLLIQNGGPPKCIKRLHDVKNNPHNVDQCQKDLAFARQRLLIIHQENAIEVAIKTNNLNFTKQYLMDLKLEDPPAYRSFVHSVFYVALHYQRKKIADFLVPSIYFDDNNGVALYEIIDESVQEDSLEKIKLLFAYENNLNQELVQNLISYGILRAKKYSQEITDYLRSFKTTMISKHKLSISL